ncbi:MAG: hypothetical protein DMF34_08410 [Verrucomicrobia bacterium]|nr:MAG: hypothetical protein DMF34_08410 [Verrucomicrobiota bacterium]
MFSFKSVVLGVSAWLKGAFLNESWDYSANRMPERRKLAAYTLPLAAFLALLALNGALKKIDNLFWLSSAEYGLAGCPADRHTL